MLDAGPPRIVVVHGGDSKGSSRCDVAPCQAFPMVVSI
jgi:hypothetical protein